MKMLTETVLSFAKHEGPMISAALAFYALLAAAPFGLFLVATIGVVYGREEARAQLVSRLTDLIGSDVAGEVGALIERAANGQTTFFATTLGALLFFLATSRVFETLRTGLNHVWEVTAVVPAGLRGGGLAVLRRRILAFLLVLFSGFIILLFVVLRATLDIVAAHFADIPFLARVAELVLGWAAVTFACAVVYRRLPDVRIVWQDAFVGASVTSLLTVLGAAVAGQYVAKIAIGSPYGAAGSLVAFLLWVYYCSQVFFFGAEFTAVWARNNGHGAIALPHARKITISEQHEGPL